MIIIEGTDALGKTTFAKKLLAKLPTHVYAHFTKLPRDFDPYWGYAERMSPRVVQDRFHLSELAYSTARKVPTIIDPEGCLLIDAALRRLGTYTVVILGSDELVRSRWDPTQMFDMQVTQDANVAFRQLAGGGRPFTRLSDYRVDVDHVITLSQEKPYADGTDAAAVLEGYARRRLAVERIARSRPAAL